jgi:hypothetical protein
MKDNVSYDEARGLLTALEDHEDWGGELTSRQRRRVQRALRDLDRTAEELDAGSVDDGEVFSLYARPGRGVANMDITTEIRYGTQAGVVRMAKQYKHLGATDTTSREKISEYWNKIHPDDPFDYDLWYR